MSRRAAAAVLAALALAGLAAPSGAQAPGQQAERQAEIDARIRTLTAEVSEASAEEAALLASLDDARHRRAALDARVALLDPQVSRAEAEADEAEAALEQVQSDFVTAQTRLALENEALAGERDRLRRRAVAAYIANPPSHAAELVLRAKDLRDIAATAGYLESVVEVQRQAVRRYTARRDATDALRAVVEVQKDAARRQRDVVVNRLSDLEGLRAELAAVRGEAAAEEARHADLLERVRQRRAEFEAQIAALRAESKVVGALLRGLAVPAGTVAVAPGRLGLPVAGFAVTSRFGPRLHPIFQTVRDHDGVDFAAPSGVPVRAAAAGTVVAAGPRGGYGNATIVDHGGGLATLYAHQSELFVTAGTVVAAGQVIGAVGSTGFSTGPHLHFEVRVGGVPVDPLSFLAAG
ncbi:MAG: peptidoglycan DD-metalloendopeptidase family protein [Acidimicrobiia bacterium]